MMEVTKNRNYEITSADEEIEVQRANVFSMLWKLWKSQFIICS